MIIDVMHRHFDDTEARHVQVKFILEGSVAIAAFFMAGAARRKPAPSTLLAASRADDMWHLRKEQKPVKLAELRERSRK